MLLFILFSRWGHAYPWILIKLNVMEIAKNCVVKYFLFLLSWILLLEAITWVIKTAHISKGDKAMGSSPTLCQKHKSPYREDFCCNMSNKKNLFCQFCSFCPKKSILILAMNINFHQYYFLFICKSVKINDHSEAQDVGHR